VTAACRIRKIKNPELRSDRCPCGKSWSDCPNQALWESLKAATDVVKTLLDGLSPEEEDFLSEHLDVLVGDGSAQSHVMTRYVQ
jgi:hypothetical protein